MDRLGSAMQAHRLQCDPDADLLILVLEGADGQKDSIYPTAIATWQLRIDTPDIAKPGKVVTVELNCIGTG